MNGLYFSEGPNGTPVARPVQKAGAQLLDPETGTVLIDGEVPEGNTPGCFLPETAEAPAEAEPAKKKKP